MSKLNMGKGGYTNWDEFLASEANNVTLSGATLNVAEGDISGSISINTNGYRGEFHSLFPEYELKSDKPNNVESPKHYTQGKLEVIEVLKDKMSREQYKGFLLGNVLKYSMRFEHKNGLEDLNKAKVYLEWLIELEQEI